MLNEAQVVEIAEKINARVNIPILSESTEEKIFEVIINNINSKLDEAVAGLPPLLKDIWDKLEAGITDEEAKELTPKLIEAANEKVNFPFLSEEAEARLVIAPAIELIIETVRAKTS